MKDQIERLEIVQQQLETLVSDDNLEQAAILTAAAAELSAIAPALEQLDREHETLIRFSTDNRTALENIGRDIRSRRREWNMFAEDGEVTCIEDDVAFLLTDVHRRMQTAEYEAAALRGTLEGIRDMARMADNDDGDLTDTHRQIYIRDLLGSVIHKATEGLKDHKSGAGLRKDIHQLEATVDAFENSMRETGGWTYSGDRTLTERLQRCINHYTRMAAEAVSAAHGFKDGTVSWLRGIAINAQAVSWGSTHHEKDARLRGLIEVIETAITKIDEQRFDDRLSRWNGAVDSWMRSDFPTREMRRRIFDLEAEVTRLKGEEAKTMQPEYPTGF